MPKSSVHNNFVDGISPQSYALRTLLTAFSLKVKAYTSRVGAGPYPTEIHGDLAKELREAGGEYGTTTGRPRRVGWLDIPCLRYATRQAAGSALLTRPSYF